MYLLYGISLCLIMVLTGCVDIQAGPGGATIKTPFSTITAGAGGDSTSGCQGTVVDGNNNIISHGQGANGVTVTIDNQVSINGDGQVYHIRRDGSVDVVTKTGTRTATSDEASCAHQIRG